MLASKAMRRRTWGLAGAAWCLAASAHALDPARAISQYVISGWATGDGLPSRSVHALCQGRDRHLWIGTSAGLARFDGARFTVFDASREPALGDAVVTSLARSADGTLFVGTSAAVVRERGGVFEALPIRPVGGRVFSLLPARDGELWVGTLGRSMRWREGRKPTPLDLGPVRPLAMIEDEDGTLWMGTGHKGLLRGREGRFTAVPVGADSVLALHRDRAGALWAGTRRGLVRLEGERLTRMTRADGLPHDSVTAILEDRDGNLWVGTAGGGLARFADGRWSALAAAGGLADDHVRCLLEDDEGNLWVGTPNGLNRLSDGPFATFSRAEGLRDTAVSAVASGRGGAVWIGTESGDVTRLDTGGAMRHHALPGGEPGHVVFLHEARDGAVWIGRDDGRLFRLRGDTLSDETPLEGAVTAAYEDDEMGLLFYLSGRGLARVEGRRAVVIAEESRRLSWVHAMVRDRTGVLWLGGAFGLGRLKDGTFRRFTKADGLPHDRVRSIQEDGQGGLWLATLGGLAHMKDETFRHVGTAHGLPQDHLRLVLHGGNGDLWIASVASIFRLSARDVVDFHAGRIPRVTAALFGEGDGLRSTEALLGSSPGFRGPDGRLWFATARGVSVVDPARVRGGETAPPVVIDGLRVDGREEPGRRFPPGRGEAVVDYSALRLRAAGRMRFRYRLEGFDEAWTEAGTRRQVHYSALPPGQYRFTVMASNGDGEYNGPPASVSFAIAPPLYRRTGFWLACVAALLVVLGAAHRLRTAQLRARFTAVLDERARIARELHDTLAQSLTGMSVQMEAALGTLDPEGESAARRHLQRVRTMVTASLAEVRRSIWVLRAQAAPAPDLEAVLEDSLAQLCAQGAARFELRVEGPSRAVPAETQRHVLRIAHEAVTNAVRHAAAGTIEVVLRYEAGALRVQVRDDGRGFDAAAASAERYGLVGMRERAQVLGGELEIESRPGAGTRVECRIPY